MKILWLITFFNVKTADLENNKYNYLLRALVPIGDLIHNENLSVREHYVAFTSNRKFNENEYVYLRLQVECQTVYGIDRTPTENYYNIEVCSTIRDLDDSTR